MLATVKTPPTTAQIAVRNEKKGSPCSLYFTVNGERSYRNQIAGDALPTKLCEIEKEARRIQ